MQYFKIKNKERAAVEMDRLVDRLFWLIDMRKVFRVGYDRFCFNTTTRVDLGEGLHQENDFEHSFLVALILWLLDEFFGNWITDIDFYTAIKVAFIHDSSEVIIGDIPHNGEGDRDEKNRLESRIMRTFLQEFPWRAEDGLEEMWEEFCNDEGIVFVADKFAFVIMIAWYMMYGVKGNWRMMKERYGRLADSDWANVQLARKRPTKSGVEILDAIYGSFLKMSKECYYRPFFLLFGEALYRRVGETVSDELRALY